MSGEGRDVVKVRVVEVDVKRKRIGLTMRKDGGEAAPSSMRENRAPAAAIPCAMHRPSRRRARAASLAGSVPRSLRR